MPCHRIEREAYDLEVVRTHSDHEPLLDPNGKPWTVLEFLDGEGLRVLLCKHCSLTYWVRSVSLG